MAQNSLSDLEKLSLFSNSDEIINGETWVYTKKYVGHPFWGDDTWYKCDVNYKGNLYEGVDARYDICTDGLILFVKSGDEARSFILNKQYLKNFTLYAETQGKAISFFYEPLVDGETKFIYTKAYQGETSYYVQYKKYINNVVKDNYTGEYLSRARLFLEKGGDIVEFDSPKSMLKSLEDKKTELKKYMRKHKIKVDRKNPMRLAAVFEYYDSLSKE